MRRSSEPEHAASSDYLSSVSDLMAGLLFVFILMVAAFAIQLTDQREKEKAAQEKAKTDRSSLLLELEDILRESGLTVSIDLDQGVLRLGESVLFPEGRALPDEARRPKLVQLASALATVLPKYTDSHGVGDRKHIDALFIEGHTDDKQITNTIEFRDNWELSMMRSINIYKFLKASQPLLDSLMNSNGHNILCVSGYAETRPVKDPPGDLTPEMIRERNRRIDLRFLMESPFESEVDLTRAADHQESGLPVQRDPRIDVRDQYRSSR